MTQEIESFINEGDCNGHAQLMDKWLTRQSGTFVHVQPETLIGISNQRRADCFREEYRASLKDPGYDPKHREWTKWALTEVFGFGEDQL